MGKGITLDDESNQFKLKSKSDRELLNLVKQNKNYHSNFNIKQQEIFKPITEEVKKLSAKNNSLAIKQHNNVIIQEDDFEIKEV